MHHLLFLLEVLLLSFIPYFGLKFAMQEHRKHIATKTLIAQFHQEEEKFIAWRKANLRLSVRESGEAQMLLLEMIRLYKEIKESEPRANDAFLRYAYFELDQFPARQMDSA